MIFPQNQSEEDYIEYIANIASQKTKWLGNNKDLYVKAICLGIVKEIGRIFREYPSNIARLPTELKTEFDTETPENEIELLKLAIDFGDLFYYKAANSNSAERILILWNKRNLDCKLDFPTLENDKTTFLNLQKFVFER